VSLTSSIFLLPNGTFFVELAVFLFIIWVINKYAVPPLNKAMEARQTHIRSSLEAAEAARTDAAAADDERRHALDEARKQAREIVAGANRTADQVRAEAQGRGQVEYERILANAQNEVALARRRAVEEASGRMGELVLDVVERIIGREVDAATHRDLIDEAVAALNADAAGGAATAGAGSHS
jgi:F-type H+-transporting ATPase subunit b